MLDYTEPIYVTRKDTFLASDRIIPYGDRIEVESESKREAVARKLMEAFKTGDEDKRV